MHQVETLRHQLGFAVIFVTHDMSVVSHYPIDSRDVRR